MNPGTQELAQKIELLLFYEGGTMTKKALREALVVGQPEGAVVDEGLLVQALLALKDALKGRGVELYESSTDVSLRGAPQFDQFLAEYEKKTLSENVGAAAVEVLAVLLYRGASSQAEIDSIRGVNSTMTLRMLRTRGLVTKDEVEEKGVVVRNIYSLTADALAHLGATHAADVPERDVIREKLVAFEEKMKEGK
jgi:segregation and condensation protein B